MERSKVISKGLGYNEKIQKRKITIDGAKLIARS
jgi:hypothetical protein